MSILRVLIVLITALVLQLALFADLRLGGVAAEFMLGMAVAAGLTGGSARGAWFGFAAGLLMDLFLNTPFGLSASAYALAGGLIGLAHDSLMERSLMTLVGLPAVGTAAGVVAFVFGGVALGFGQVYGDDFGRILVTVVLINAVLGFVLVPLATWMWNDEVPGASMRRPL